MKPVKKGLVLHFIYVDIFGLAAVEKWIAINGRSELNRNSSAMMRARNDQTDKHQYALFMSHFTVAIRDKTE